jgi:hypothetical protein
VVAKADELRGDGRREVEHHHQVPEVLVVHDDVHRHGERGQQQVVGELDSEEEL